MFLQYYRHQLSWKLVWTSWHWISLILDNDQHPSFDNTNMVAV
jgi:hypothetical protein